jgi:hypothetical protein
MTREECLKELTYRNYSIDATERMIRLHNKSHVLSDRKLRNLAKRFRLYKMMAKAKL